MPYENPDFYRGVSNLLHLFPAKVSTGLLRGPSHIALLAGPGGLLQDVTIRPGLAV